jgi:hypothetical protein
MKYTKHAVLIISFIVFTASILFLFPAIRFSAILLLESFLKKNSYNEIVYILLRNLAITGLFISIIGCLAVLTETGKNVFNECINEWKRSFLSFINKRNLFLFLILSVIYLLGIITIIRANYYYNDDLNRALNGYRSWAGWGRYIPEFLSIIIHMNLRLTDISPLPQILAVFILAFSTIIFLKILSPDKISIATIAASVPIGLSPYIMENFSFKFDAPYMALAVFFSIVPFLLYRKTIVYFITSFFCLLAMCMSYQAASGIYIIMILIISCRSFITDEIPSKKIIHFIFVSIVSYIIPLIFFKALLLVRLQDNGYASTELLPFNNLFPGMFSNSIIYIKIIIADYKNGLIIILIPLSIFLFIAANVKASQRKVLALVVLLIAIPVTLVFSYGSYIALVKPLWLPRAFIGFGFLLAALLTYITSLPDTVRLYKILSLITAILLSYNFLIFDLSYGNALAEQKQYQNFRTAMLITDINRCIEENTEPVIQIENNIGFAPVIENISKIYPLIKRLVYVTPYGGEDWGHLLLYHFKFKHTTDYPLYNNSGTKNKSLPVLIDNQYHTISGNRNNIFVTLK